MAGPKGSSGKSGAPGGGSGKAEVTKDDQDAINSFSKLNAKAHELQAQLKAKKRLLEDLEDASNELMLLDDDEAGAVRYVVGECFVHLSGEDADARLGDLTSTINADVGELNGELDAVQDKMKALKAVLYGKFGSSINLEE